MPATGFRFPTTDTAVTGTWTTPTNVQATDAAYATVQPGKNTTASRDAGGFGFSTSIVPDGANILKVEIQAVYHCDVNTSILSFRFNGKVGSTVLANHDDAAEPLTDATTTFDITADRAWVPADFRDGTFFVRFNGVQGNSSTTVTALFNSVSVQVTWDFGGGTLLFEDDPNLEPVFDAGDFRDQAIQPVFAETVEIQGVLYAEDTFEDGPYDAGQFNTNAPDDVAQAAVIGAPLAISWLWDLVTQSFAEPHLTPDVQFTEDVVEITFLDSIELDPDEYSVGHFETGGHVEPSITGLIFAPLAVPYLADIVTDSDQSDIIEDAPVDATSEQIVVIIPIELELDVYDEGGFEASAIEQPLAQGLILAPLTIPHVAEVIEGTLEQPDVIVDSVVPSDAEQIVVVAAEELEPDIYDAGWFIEVGRGPDDPLIINEVTVVEAVELDPDVYNEGGFVELGSGPDDNTFEQVVVVDSIELEPDVYDEGRFEARGDVDGPVVVDLVAVVEAVELDPDAYDEGAFDAGTPDGPDVSEQIAVVAAEELDPDTYDAGAFEAGSGPDQPPVQILILAPLTIPHVSDDAVEPLAQPGLIEDAVTPVDTTSEQIVVIDSVELEPDVYDVGYFESGSSPDAPFVGLVFAPLAVPYLADFVADSLELQSPTDDPVAAPSIAEIVSLAAEDTYEVGEGLEFYQESPDTESILLPSVGIESSLMTLDRVDAVTESLAQSDLIEQPTALPVFSTSPLSISFQPDFVPDSFAEPNLTEDAPPVTTVESSLMILDRADIVTDSFSQTGPVDPPLVDNTFEQIVNIDSIELDPPVYDEGLFDARGIFDAPFVDTTLEQIAYIDSIELDPDVYDVGTFEAGAGPDQPAPPPRITAPLDIPYLGDAVTDSLSQPDVIEEAPGPDSIESVLSILDGFILVTESFIHPDVPSAAVAAADTTEIVTLDSIELDPDVYDVGAFETHLTQAAAAAADTTEIVAVDSIELDPDVYDAGHYLDEAIAPVFDSTVEIVVLDSIELDPDDPGLAYVDDGAIQPSSATIVTESVFVDSIELDPDVYDAGHFLDEAIAPIFADTTEIVALDSIELDPDVYDVGYYLDEAIRPVTPDLSGIVTVEAEDDFVPEGGLDYVEPVIVVGTPLPVHPPRTVRSTFNRFAAVLARNNKPDDKRDNKASDTRGKPVTSRRFNTWRSD